MQMSTYIAMQLLRLEAWPALAMFLELALKSTLLMLLCLAVTPLLRRSTAAHRHLPYAACIFALGLLPLLLTVMPALTLALLPAVDSIAAASPDPSDRAAPWWSALLYLYAAGVAALLLHSLLALLRIVVLNLQAGIVTDPLALRLRETILQDELSEVPVLLKQSSALSAPVSWGLLQPVIILPTDFVQWPEGKLRHVLLHEISHIQRLDWGSLIMGRFVCALYWYNPLVWLLTRRLSQLAEHACDDAVLRATSRHADYAEDLVAMARHALPRARIGLLVQAMAATFLGSRVAAILDEHSSRATNDSVWVIRCMLSAAMLAAVLAALRVETADSATNLLPPPRFTLILQRAAEPAPTPEGPATTERPQLLLSLTVPELDVVQVRPQLPVSSNASAVLRPRISVEAVPAPLLRQPAQLLHKRFPDYPALARARGIEGQVLIEYGIDRHGAVLAPTVVEAEPPEWFEQSALDAIRDYRYDPPRIDGRPVPIQGLRTRFVFRLNADSG